MSFSFGHFFKRLPYKLSRSLTRQQNPFPLTNHKPRTQLTSASVFKKNSVPCSCYSSSSSAEAPSAEFYTPPYLSVRIRCQRHALDMFSEALLCFGASSTSVDEDDDQGCENADEIYVDSIFPECEDVDECIVNAANSIGLKEIPHYEVKMGEQWDWIKKTQESFQPVEVTGGLWIVPQWSKRQYDYLTLFRGFVADVQATNIILNPGLAFGTGEHATTKLCLLLLQSLIIGGELLLDYGTGSGILGIAAIKFGAALSVGVDIDPQAIKSAGQNAALNNIGPEKMELHLVPETFPASMSEKADGLVDNLISYQIGEISEKEKYDVVMANILLNPLLELADHIVSYAKPGAVVGISGFLSEQLPQIISHYSQFLECISVSEMDDGPA